MAQDPIRKYSDAIGELEKVRAQVMRLQETIGRMNSYLENPYELMISNVSVGFPAEVTLGRNIHNFNANDWPQIKQIAEALANLHNKRKVIEEAWHNLSDTDKGLVNPPPEKK
jgi:hypothetical protein